MKKIWNKLTPFNLLIFCFVTHGYDIVSTIVALGFFGDIFQEAMPIWFCMIEYQGLIFTVLVVTALKIVTPFFVYYSIFGRDRIKLFLLIYGAMGLPPCINNTYQFILGMIG